MKNKKSLVAIGVLLLVAIVGGTLAYYTSSSSFENVFNTGKYKIVTTEIFESPDKWVPGETITKTVTTKNEGTVDATVKISYIEKWETADGTYHLYPLDVAFSLVHWLTDIYNPPLMVKPIY